MIRTRHTVTDVGSTSRTRADRPAQFISLYRLYRYIAISLYRTSLRSFRLPRVRTINGKLHGHRPPQTRTATQTLILRSASKGYMWTWRGSAVATCIIVAPWPSAPGLHLLRRCGAPRVTSVSGFTSYRVSGGSRRRLTPDPTCRRAAPYSRPCHPRLQTARRQPWPASSVWWG